jgi:hypothetical protein
MKNPIYSFGRTIRLLPIILLAGLLACSASLEKRLNLTGYETAVHGMKGSGEVYLARPVLEERLSVLPGGRIVLGYVKGTGEQLVTQDDLSEWVADALARELQSSGYEVKRSPGLPAHASGGIVVRIVQLSAGQTDGLVLATTTNIRLAADIWKNDRLVKTITAGANSKDEGIDRSGEFVAASLRKQLQLVMQELVPDIVGALSSP